VQAIDGELETLEHDEPAVYEAHARDPWPKVEEDAARAASDLAARVGYRVDGPWLEGRSAESFVAGYAIRQRVRAVADAILDMLPADARR